MKEFKPQTSVKYLLKASFDLELDIDQGTGTADDPIQMPANAEYVHGEYEVLEFLGYYRSVGWQRLSQKLIHNDSRYCDCITISVWDLMDSSKETWQEEFYFDVSDCLVEILE